MAFFFAYLEVAPHSRLVWTKEEYGENFQITTVTFEERDDRTLLVVTDLYPSKEALDEAIATKSTGALPQQFEQLDVILAEMGSTRPLGAKLSKGAYLRVRVLDGGFWQP